MAKNAPTERRVGHEIVALEVIFNVQVQVDSVSLKFGQLLTHEYVHSMLLCIHIR